MRATFLLLSASLLILTGWVSAARRESVEPYYLEFTVQSAISGSSAACRLFYYHQRREVCEFQRASAISDLSPDGRYRALADADGLGRWTIFRAQAHGGTPKAIINLSAIRVIGSLAWSHDGRWLAISAGLSTNDLDMFRLHVESGELQQITMTEGNEFSPAWSVDGDWIAFNASETINTNRLFIMRADGSEAREVLPGLAGSYRPAWSPDGEWLVFETGCSEVELRSLGVLPCDLNNFNLFLLRLADGEIKTLVARPGDEYAAAWSPDGQWIAYSFRTTATPPQIYRVRPDGSNVQALTSDPGISYYAPAWAATPDLAWRPFFLLMTAFVLVSVFWWKKP